MPTTSKKKPRSKSFFQREKYTAELSSGQLVVGISILILFGLTCFLLGILLGRSEYARTVEYAKIPQTQDLGSAGAPDGQSREQALTLGNTPPIVHRLPAPQPPNPMPIPEADTLSSLTGEQDSPAPPSESPAPVEDNVTTTEVVTPATTSTPEKPVAPEVSLAETPGPLVTSVDIANAPYTVQVGAFGKRANAEAAKKKIESKTAYPVRLVDKPENKITVVLVGAFQDRNAADTARVILRDKLGYTDSYIKKNDK